MVRQPRPPARSPAVGCSSWSRSTASAASPRTRRSSTRPSAPARATTSSSRSAPKQGLSIEDTYWAVVIDDIIAATEVLAAGLRRAATAATASCRSRSRRRSRTTPRARSRRRATCTAASNRPNLMIKIPATLEGLPAIEETIASGITVNVTLIFSLDRHAKVIEAYLDRARAAGRVRRRPVDGRVGGVVLREPGRHRDRPAPPRGQPAAGQGRGRQRQARVRAVPRPVLRAAMGRAGGEGRAAAAAAVGVDVDEEPGVLAHPLRRRAHRSRHRQHAGAGVDRGAAARRGRPAGRTP